MSPVLASLAPPPLQFGILGYAVRLAEPGALWMLAVVAALAILGAVAIARRRAALRAAAGSLAPRVAPLAGSGRPTARLSLQILGLTLFTLALAQPQCGTRTQLGKRYGIDLVIALDASNSMQARDVRPSRLSRAVLELSELIDRLGGDRVAVVAFAAEAFVQCPLTTDYAAAKLFLRAIRPDSIPQQGTSVARALDAAKQVLAAADRGAKAKAVLLLSDGEDHEAGALEAAEALANDGVRIYAVGIGSAAGEPIPVVDRAGNVTGYKRDRNGETVVTRLDDRLLREVTARTDGRYVHADDGSLGVETIQEELDRLDKSELEGRLTVEYEDRHAFFAFPGFLALLAAGLLGEAAGRRRLPIPVAKGAVR
jgi:Ca-activated chloride channel family protein